MIWGRNREAYDLLRASLEMLVEARQAEIQADLEAETGTGPEAGSGKTETNGAIDECQ